MEYVMGRPGPLPEFDGPEGMVRGANRPGPVFPRTSWPSIGAAYLATLGIAAALRAREVTGTGQRVTTSLLQGALAAVTSELAEGGATRRAPVLDVAFGRQVDRGHLRVCRRTLGAPLDAPAQLGPPGGGGGRPLAGRRRLLLPRGPRPGLDGGRRPAPGHHPVPGPGGGIQEVPGRGLGEGGRGRRIRRFPHPFAGRSTLRPVLHRGWVRRRGRRSRGRAHSPRGSASRFLRHPGCGPWACAAIG